MAAPQSSRNRLDAFGRCSSSSDKQRSWACVDEAAVGHPFATSLRWGRAHTVAQIARGLSQVVWMRGRSPATEAAFSAGCKDLPGRAHLRRRGPANFGMDGVLTTRFLGQRLFGWPLVLALLGMLEPWALAQRPRRKQLALRF